jgi:hypothetical protein
MQETGNDEQEKHGKIHMNNEMSKKIARRRRNGVASLSRKAI